MVKMNLRCINIVRIITNSKNNGGIALVRLTILFLFSRQSLNIDSSRHTSNST